jgi:ketosteroid isomerase-like protein
MSVPTTNTQRPATGSSWPSAAAAEVEILAILAEITDAHAARDAARLVAPYTADAVRYSLAPPLQQRPGTMVGDIEGVRRWLDTFDGPITIEYREPVVMVGGDVAFVHALTRMVATPAGSPDPFSLWFRTTLGLRRAEGTWSIAHEHSSTPFLMDGSFLAATDLEP